MAKLIIAGPLNEGERSKRIMTTSGAPNWKRFATSQQTVAKKSETERGWAPPAGRPGCCALGPLFRQSGREQGLVKRLHDIANKMAYSTKPLPRTGADEAGRRRFWIFCWRSSDHPEYAKKKKSASTNVNAKVHQELVELASPPKASPSTEITFQGSAFPKSSLAASASGSQGWSGHPRATYRSL